LIDIPWQFPVLKVRGIIMGYLLGLQEYLDQKYHLSIFDQALESKKPWEMQVHGSRIINALILENQKYDLKLTVTGGKSEILPKVQVKLLYPEEVSQAVRPRIRTDKKVKDLKLDPILSPRKRYHIKNKSLFPLMKESQVLFFTLLEGEIVRGILSGFSRYEVTVNLKGGVPVTILRHSIFDLRDKKGRCYLKSFQEKHRDWERSDLYTFSQQDTVTDP
jgi:hypothetical protein